ncbi:energy transducer TonB [Psychroserpens luteolus]|uniref:energy transducer TonB n=1 Tax=Psychroserpens luteolus TaxID=2855840 RepID=UPI001E65AD8E|nr:hypothetical protein [Psychroserpens luteolus]MCD2259181.1 hypothetical protein [Psychroserpens luteolus]
MTYLPKFKVVDIRYLLFLIALILLSCKDNTKSSDSELIHRINAVHEQIMIQGNVTEEEKQAILSLASLFADDSFVNYKSDITDVIQFDDVENGPIYPGCEGLSKQELKACFIESISIFVGTQFNSDISKNLGITEPQDVEVFFKIGRDGKTSKLKVRKANVVIQAEVIRVIKQLPLMKPATQNGETVEVMCSTVVSYGGNL